MTLGDIPIVPLERVQHLEREVRTGQAQMYREIAVERGITRDLVEALHKRLDDIETEWVKELRSIKTDLATLVARGANGHG